MKRASLWSGFNCGTGSFITGCYHNASDVDLIEQKGYDEKYGTSYTWFVMSYGKRVNVGGVRVGVSITPAAREQIVAEARAKAQEKALEVLEADKARYDQMSDYELKQAVAEREYDEQRYREMDAQKADQQAAAEQRLADLRAREAADAQAEADRQAELDAQYQAGQDALGSRIEGYSGEAARALGMEDVSSGALIDETTVPEPKKMGFSLKSPVLWIVLAVGAGMLFTGKSAKA